MSNNMRNTMANQIATPHNLWNNFHKIEFSPVDNYWWYGLLAGQWDIIYKSWSDTRHAGLLANMKWKQTWMVLNVLLDISFFRNSTELQEPLCFLIGWILKIFSETTCVIKLLHGRIVPYITLEEVFFFIDPKRKMFSTTGQSFKTSWIKYNLRLFLSETTESFDSKFCWNVPLIVLYQYLVSFSYWLGIKDDHQHKTKF